MSPTPAGFSVEDSFFAAQLFGCLLVVVGASFILLGLAAATVWGEADVARRLPEFVRTLTGL